MQPRVSRRSLGAKLYLPWVGRSGTPRRGRRLDNLLDNTGRTEVVAGGKEGAQQALFEIKSLTRSDPAGRTPRITKALLYP